MAPPKTDFDREMQHLDAEMRRLVAEYNMFFSGRLPRLPWETRALVEALVKKADRSVIRNTADRFRFETMQNRFAKFGELWERQLSAREGGRPRRGGQAPPPAAAVRTPEKTAPSIGEGERVVRFSKGHDPGADADRVKELHEKLAAVKQAAGEAAVPIERVAALVKAQVEKYAAEGRDVSFRVAMKDGKVSLTVTPVKPGEN